jgi:hypothetical protein
VVANIKDSFYIRPSILYPMKLNLSVEGRVLASIPVDASKAGDEYYLKAFRRLLVIRYHKDIARLNKVPIFFLELPVAENSKQNRPLKGAASFC